MDLITVRDTVLRGTYREVLPAKFDTREANVLLLAIGLQESKFEHRLQVGGPARGFWQFERGGGVTGVLSHEDTRDYAKAVCAIRTVATFTANVYAALADDDLLACSFARLLLWSDPSPLPELGHAGAAWEYYLRNWRPGKPHERTWGDYYSQALKALA
jgi:hypothetical protein